MITIPIPGLKTSTGLGDAVASVTKAVGVKPCGCCKQRQEALNRVFTFQPWKTALPDGYKLRLQGQHDSQTQILLGQNGGQWATWKSTANEIGAMHGPSDEAAARADFAQRMKS